MTIEEVTKQDLIEALIAEVSRTIPFPMWQPDTQAHYRKALETCSEDWIMRELLEHHRYNERVILGREYERVIASFNNPKCAVINIHTGERVA